MIRGGIGAPKVIVAGALDRVEPIHLKVGTTVRDVMKMVKSRITINWWTLRMMNSATRYRCTGCGLEKFIPERPSEAQRTVNTGCDRCQSIVRHKRVGVR